jgi:hypothetical protein
MIAGNSVTGIAPSLRAQVRKLRADALSKQEFEGLDPDVIKGLLDILDQAESVLAEFAGEEVRVQTNVDWSDAGRQKEMTKVVREAQDKLRVVEKKATERRQAYDSESAVIHAAPKLTSDSSALREMEIRQRWQKTPLHEQMRAYLTASEHGWRDTLRAFKDVETFGDDPRLASYMQRVDQERFEEKEPRQAARLKALKYSAEVLQALAMGIDFRLSGYADMPSFSGTPTRHTDLNYTDVQAPPDKASSMDKPPTHTPAFR